jgi:hypothetical protein
MSTKQTVAVILALVVVGVVARLIPHIPNFAPLTATALFAGVYMSRRASLILPLVILLASDYLLLFINPYGRVDFSHLYGPQALWHSSLPYVYISFGISALVGWLIKNERSPFLVASAALFCSVQFFLITNAAVWIEGAYDRGIAGLWQAYVAGIPFYRGTVLGDLFYTTVFFGLYELVRSSRAAAPAVRQAAGSAVQWYRRETSVL